MPTKPELETTHTIETSEWPKRIPAPLGLAEWECSNGQTFYSELAARARQSGLDKRAEFERTAEAADSLKQDQDSSNACGFCVHLYCAVCAVTCCECATVKAFPVNSLDALVAAEILRLKNERNQLAVVGADLTAERDAFLTAARAALKYVDNLNEETPMDMRCTACMMATVYYTKGTPVPELCWIHQLEKIVKKEGK